MVDWTAEERSIIENIFATVDYDDIGPKALVRCLTVYPWTQRYFGGFGDVSCIEAIKSNDKIAKHGVVVLRGLEKAAQNLDCIKAIYSELSVLHSEKLHVDPDNFRLLGDCLTIVLAAKLGAKFTAQVQAAFQKFLSVAVSALGRQYH